MSDALYIGISDGFALSPVPPENLPCDDDTGDSGDGRPAHKAFILAAFPWVSPVSPVFWETNGIFLHVLFGETGVQAVHGFLLIILRDPALRKRI